MNKNRLRYIALAAMIAALYLLLFLPLKPIGFGPIQFRLAEILTLLPALTPAAIPGVFLGCVLANIVGPAGHWVDIVFGSLATLIAAILTRILANRTKVSEQYSGYTSKELAQKKALYLLPLPTIIINALIVGTYLTLVFTDAAFSWTLLITNVLSLALSEAFVLYVIALPLYIVLQPYFTRHRFDK